MALIALDVERHGKSLLLVIGDVEFHLHPAPPEAYGEVECECILGLPRPFPMLFIPRALVDHRSQSVRAKNDADSIPSHADALQHFEKYSALLGRPRFGDTIGQLCRSLERRTEVSRRSVRYYQPIGQSEPIAQETIDLVEHGVLYHWRGQTPSGIRIR